MDFCRAPSCCAAERLSGSCTDPSICSSVCDKRRNCSSRSPWVDLRAHTSSHTTDERALRIRMTVNTHQLGMAELCFSSSSSTGSSVSVSSA